ncbi:hypothetical protein [Pedobacter namyangjuensis]|uniref:hypothetical protein n=1 Tax=Pedobacter namyangjuensis TaxID=600626 RepID=UPI000DE484E2|nr:hypothetical protein [Pedobacter namyangjuensis]
MKTFKISIKLLVLIISLVIFSCKKDKNNIKSSFDINNPKGYAIIYKYRNVSPSTTIAVFNESNKVTYGGTHTLGIASFRVSNDQLILDDDGIDLVFKIENEKIVSFSDNIKTAELIKIPDENQLLAKTFTGTYFNKDGSILHPKFFYKFETYTNKVDAGYDVGTTVRTENYTSMGNVAAFIQNNGYVEFIIKMPDGTIESNYSSKNSNAYGVFK